MTPRIDTSKYMTSGLVRALFSMGREIEAAGLDRRTYELVQIRASQLNGCAYCLDMHTKDARALGESEQRLYAISAWRETPFFSDRERAALEWTEALTMIANGHPSDDVYERVSRQFDEAGMVALTFAVMVINSWNRLVITARPVVGGYQPAAMAASIA